MNMYLGHSKEKNTRREKMRKKSRYAEKREKILLLFLCDPPRFSHLFSATVFFVTAAEVSDEC
jgi:hypothetical protein